MANIDEKLGQTITTQIESQEDEISKHGGVGISFDDIIESSSQEDESATSIDNKNSEDINKEDKTSQDQTNNTNDFIEQKFDLDEINITNKNLLNDIELLDTKDESLDIVQDESIQTNIIGDQIRFYLEGIDFSNFNISISYSSGDLEILEDGEILFTPDSGFTGDVDLLLEAIDENQDRFSQNITVSVDGDIENSLVKIGNLTNISLETVDGTINIIDDNTNETVEQTIDESTIDKIDEQTVDAIPENTIDEQTVSKVDEQTVPEDTVAAKAEETVDEIAENSVSESTIDARGENTVDESTIDSIPENTADESTIDGTVEQTIDAVDENTTPEDTNEARPEETIGENTISEIPEDTNEAIAENTIDENTQAQVDEVTNDEQTVDQISEDTTPAVAEQTVDEQTIDEIIGGGAEDTSPEQTTDATSEEIIDIEALKEQGITQGEDGKFYKVDGQKQVEQEFTKQETRIVDVDPIMKKGLVEQEVEILGKEHIDSGATIGKKSTHRFDFEEPTSNIEIDFNNFNKGTAKISFYDENGDKIGNTINQSHTNDTRGYSVPDGAVGVSIKNNTNSSDFEIESISYRAESTFETTMVEGLVPDTETMEELGYFYSNIEQNSVDGEKIFNIGNIGNGNVRGFNPEDNETQTISLGKEFANREVTITIDVDVKGSWDYNGSNAVGSTNDIFTISSNGVPLETHNYSSSWKHNGTELDNSNHTYEYKVFLDENGEVELNFMVASTANNEIINVKDIDVSFEGANGWYKEETVDVVYTDVVVVDNIVEVSFNELPKTTIDVPEETIDGYENYDNIPEQTIEENTIDAIAESTTDAIPENTVDEEIVTAYKDENTVDEQTSESIPEDTINGIPEQTIDEQTLDAVSEQTIAQVVNSSYIPEQTRDAQDESTIDEQTNEALDENTIDEQTIDSTSEQTIDEQTNEAVPEETVEASDEQTTPSEVIEEAQGENTVDESTVDEIAEQTIDEVPENTIEEQTIEESNELEFDFENTIESDEEDISTDLFNDLEQIDLSSVSNTTDEENSLDTPIIEEQTVNSENISTNINEIENLINNNDSGDVI